jgi:hypothetical protein
MIVLRAANRNVKQGVQAGYGTPDGMGSLPADTKLEGGCHGLRERRTSMADWHSFAHHPSPRAVHASLSHFLGALTTQESLGARAGAFLFGDMVDAGGDQ